MVYSVCINCYINTMKKNIIINGERFNRLTIIKETEPKIYKNGKKGRMVLCVCDCGNKKEIIYGDVKKGHTKSCGCFAKEVNLTNSLKHGLAKTRFYDIYYKMKSRCQNKNNKDYPDYGGRGIKFLWKSFDEFKDSMYTDYLKHKKANRGTNTRIDRIDNNKNYCKENCRWATHREQARNRRSNHLLTYKGKTMTLTEWAEKVGLPRYTLNNRIIKYNWSIKDALTLPNKIQEKNAKLYTYNNKSRSLLNWSKETGIKKETLRSRIKMYNWPLEKALTTPLRNKK